MRLDNFVNEEINVEQYLPHIKKKCSMAIKVMISAQRLMYRGLSGSGVYTGGSNKANDLIRKKVRKNRKPKDSWEEYSEYLDQELKDKFGWKPRSEGLFATSNMVMANEYGIMYIVFPVGNFKYVWNTEEKDNLKITGSRWNEGPKPNAGLMEPKIYREAQNNFTDKNIETALKKGHEIMIKCDEYFGIKDTWLHNNMTVVKKEFGARFPAGY